jgi:hypothetical protein
MVRPQQASMKSWICLWLVWLAACHGSSSKPGSPGSSGSASTLSRDRIFIMGASVSAGFGGLSFVDAMKPAAINSLVDGAANVMLFRDPLGDTEKQFEAARKFRPTIVVALDLLFWDAYGFPEQSQRRKAIASTLAQLDLVHDAGATIVVGDIPRITTASPIMLDPSLVPSVEDLAVLNAELLPWAEQGAVSKYVVPLSEWTAPLKSNAMVVLPDGRSVSPTTLMAPDGLHTNAMGTYYLLATMDAWLEQHGMKADVFAFSPPR